MKRTGIPHDTWEEEALQRAKWPGLLRKATSAVEEQRQQEYQRAHDRRHSAAPLSIFQCNNIVSVTADPERV